MRKRTGIKNDDLKIYTLEEAKDKLIGKRGTAREIRTEFKYRYTCRYDDLMAAKKSITLRPQRRHKVSQRVFLKKISAPLGLYSTNNA